MKSRLDIRKQNILMLAVLFAIFISAFLFLTQKNQEIEKTQLLQVNLVNSKNEYLRINAEIADNESEQLKGLGGRGKIPSDRGMLFVFQEEYILNFWMKDMKFALDMIFLDSQFNIVDIKQNLQPCKPDEACPIYFPQKPAQYVLEINAGLAKRNNIKIGDRAIV